MRPASLVLVITGVGLLLGTALVASFKIPCRVETFTPDLDSSYQVIRIDSNVWGQSLRAVTTSSDIRFDASGRPVGWGKESGPYHDGLRQGMWRRYIEEPGKPDIVSDIWYLDGREVSAAEWEQRQ